MDDPHAPDPIADIGDRRDHVWLPSGRAVPTYAVRVSATPAGGPGGQHANRSATRVEVRMSIAACGLTAEQQQDVRTHHAGRISAQDELVVWAGERRSQLQNRRAAYRRLEALIRAALDRPEPRIATRTPRRAHEQRLDAKRRRSQRKRDRRWRPDGTD